MLPDRAPSIGRLTYSFERLYCSLVHAGSVEHRPVFGRAVISYDGRGQWWVSTITCHSRTPGRPDFAVTPGGALWLEIVIGLERHHGEPIAAAINAALDDGMHMALFDEHRPPEGARFGTPPHVSFALRRAGDALADAAEHVASVVALVLLLGSILVAGSIATMPWPGHQPGRVAPRAVALVAEAAR